MKSYAVEARWIMNGVRRCLAMVAVGSLMGLLAGCGHFPGFELRVGGARAFEAPPERPPVPEPRANVYPSPPAPYRPVHAPWTACREPAPGYSPTTQPHPLTMGR